MKIPRFTGVTVRTARLEERALLEDIMRRASLVSDSYREQLQASPEEMSVPAELFAGGTVFVAELDGVIAGFCAVAMDDPRTAELDGLFVEPELWGEGVGRQLVEHGSAAARSLGAQTITVIAGPAARPFYERCGFAVEAAAVTKFGPAARMRRALGS
ncbi:MAG: GNAT family N-acetyltransferase [Rhizobiaceae bacterium]|nr:GNAT family N-acetyltransferase [Rhizobiaceae bacterium]